MRRKEQDRINEAIRYTENRYALAIDRIRSEYHAAIQNVCRYIIVGPDGDNSFGLRAGATPADAASALRALYEMLPQSYRYAVDPPPPPPPPDRS